MEGQRGAESDVTSFKDGFSDALVKVPSVPRTLGSIL